MNTPLRAYYEERARLGAPMRCSLALDADGKPCPRPVRWLVTSPMGFSVNCDLHAEPFLCARRLDDGEIANRSLLRPIRPSRFWRAVLWVRWKLGLLGGAS